MLTTCHTYQVTFINITTDFIRRVLLYWEAGKLQWVSVFHNFKFLLDSLNLITGSKYVQSVVHTKWALKWQAHLVHFQENICLMPILNNSSLWFFPVKIVFLEKKKIASSVCNSNYAFLWENHCTWWQQKHFMRITSFVLWKTSKDVFSS